MVSEKDVANANEKWFDSYADKYESKEALYFDTICSNIPRVLKFLKKRSAGKSLLDVGCGPGNLLKFAVKDFDVVWGMDISSEMLRLSKRYTKNVKKGDVSKLPFKEASFDVLTYYSVLHNLHPVATKKTLSEAFRVLNKGGVLYTAYDPNKRNVSKNIYACFGSLMDNSKKSKVKSLHKLAEFQRFHGGMDPIALKTYLKRLGFSKVKIIYNRTGTRPPSFIFAPLYLLRDLLEDIFPKHFCLNFSLYAKK